MADPSSAAPPGASVFVFAWLLRRYTNAGQSAGPMFWGYVALIGAFVVLVQYVVVPALAGS